MFRLWKLLALVAVLLMPLGMAAPAAAVPHHDMMAAMPMEHCPDESNQPDTRGGFPQCAMACAAALPAAFSAATETTLIIGSPLPAGVAQRLNGLHPETATPPPKRS